MKKKHHVVIIGGGFAGLYAAKSLKDKEVEVTLIDRRNFHLFQPLLYQVATGGLSPGDIASPLRAVLSHRKNVRVLLGEVVDIDPEHRCVYLRDDEIEYDSLLVATGVSHSYFGNNQWKDWAPGLKSIEDATEMRRRIFLAFEAAERENDPEKRRAWLNFVIVGGGPTGVELAGALGELAHHTLVNDFRSLNPQDAHIMLVEGTDRVLPGYPHDLSDNAKKNLERLGVTVRTGTLVTDIQPKQVTLKQGDTTELLTTRTVLWAAGVEASGIAKILQQRADAKINRQGKVFVNEKLELDQHPEIMVLGDLAHIEQDGQPVPGLAPAAMQMGRYAAKRIKHQLKNKPAKPFRYYDKGNLAVIGRSKAVADIKGLHISGFFAWLLWVFVHIMYLVEFDNRVLVLFQWAWSYFTKNRGARLITGMDLIELKEFERKDVNKWIEKETA